MLPLRRMQYNAPESTVIKNGFAVSLNGNLYRSEDGLTWVMTVKKCNCLDARKILMDGYFWRVTTSGGYATVSYSEDGQTWKTLPKIDVTSQFWEYDIHAANGKLILNKTHQRMTDTTSYIFVINYKQSGAAWTNADFSCASAYTNFSTSETTATTANGRTFMNGRYTGALISNGYTIFYADDLASWSKDHHDSGLEINDVAYLNGYYYSNIYHSQSRTYELARSTDGINWSGLGLPGGHKIFLLQSLNGRLIACAYDNGYIGSSTDGTNWSWANTGATDVFSGCAYGAGRYVAPVYMDSNKKPIIAVSTDAVNWELRTITDTETVSSVAGIGYKSA